MDHMEALKHLVQPADVLASGLEHFKFVEIQGKGFRFWRLDYWTNHKDMVAKDEVALCAGLIVMDDGKPRMADSWSSSLGIGMHDEAAYKRLDAALGVKVLSRFE